MFDEIDPTPACRFCTHAHGEEDALFFFCTQKACEVYGDGLCPLYTYDLLKRIPGKRPAPTLSGYDLPREEEL